MNHIVINKGHNIRINGIPAKDVISIPGSGTVAISPRAFRGVKPKLLVDEGDNVQIGSPLFLIKPNRRSNGLPRLTGQLKQFNLAHDGSLKKLK